MEFLCESAGPLATILLFVTTLLGLGQGLIPSEGFELRGRRIQKKHVAITLGCLAFATLCISLRTQREQYLRDHRVAVREYPDQRDLKEASGAVSIGDYAYVVNDEAAPGVSPIRRLRWQGNGSDAFYSTGQPCSASAPEGGPNLPDDLEAIASNGAGSLVLVTSHSNSRKGKDDPARRWLLGATVDPSVEECKLTFSKPYSGLRTDIVAALVDFPEFSGFKAYAADVEASPCLKRSEILQPGCGAAASESGLAVLQIEGLAIVPAHDGDPERAFLGLRAPLLSERAAILVAEAATLFHKPKFRVARVPLRYGGHNYGISSLDYDPVRDRFVILGNSPDSAVVLSPIVCTWSRSEKEDPKCHPLPYFKDPVPWARPEGLAFAPNGDLAIFLDGDTRAYGQAIFSPKVLGIE